MKMPRRHPVRELGRMPSGHPVSEIKEMHGSVIITGAAGGLGTAFAHACATRGWPVVLCDIEDARLTRLAEGIRRCHSTPVSTHSFDMTDPGARKAFWDALAQSGQTVGMLINVAGLDHEGAVQDLPPESLLTIIRLNIEGTVYNMRRVMDCCKSGEILRILNVSSLASFQPMPLKAAYAASKRFLLDFSRAVHAEMRGRGVTVTALCPAGMPTNQACLDSIATQGLAGILTTRNVGDVAELALNAALQGRTLVIPGFLNQWMRTAAACLPKDWLAARIHDRWTKTRNRLPA